MRDDPVARRPFARAIPASPPFDSDRTDRPDRLPDDNASRQSGFAERRTSLPATAAQAIPLTRARRTPFTRIDPIEWTVAHRLFGQPVDGFREFFLPRRNDGFAAPLPWLNFTPDRAPARLAINDWLAGETRHRSTRLIPLGGGRDAARRVLVNALDLTAPWDRPFPVSSTSPPLFPPTPTTTGTIPTMVNRSSRGDATADDLTVATLGDLGQGRQGVLLLPDAGPTIDAAAACLAASPISTPSLRVPSPCSLSVPITSRPTFVAVDDAGTECYTVTLPAEKTVFFRGVVTYYVTSDFERF